MNTKINTRSMLNESWESNAYFIFPDRFKYVGVLPQTN
jgi:hypothetical protein